ncbi:MAG: GIY-YIG nuclease family protein [Chloroflexi bacterium]|nr:GIY-YIG nuclease family protein [Chloroflexota bacterium]
MSHHVYIVRCANGALYTGYAMDVAVRVQKHNQGNGAKYTRMNGPVKLLVSWEVASRIEALKLEQRIKRLSRPQKLALVAGRATLPSVAGLPDSAIWKKRRARR